MCAPEPEARGSAVQPGLAVRIHGFYRGLLGLTHSVALRLLVVCRIELGDFWSRSRPLLFKGSSS